MNCLKKSPNTTYQCMYIHEKFSNWYVKGSVCKSMEINAILINAILINAVLINAVLIN